MPPVVLVRQIRRLAPKLARRMRFAVGRDTGQVQARVFINQFASIKCRRLRSSDGMIENNAIFCHRYLSLSERKYRRLSVSFQGPGLTNLSLYQSRHPKRHCHSLMKRAPGLGKAVLPEAPALPFKSRRSVFAAQPPCLSRLFPIQRFLSESHRLGSPQDSSILPLHFGDQLLDHRDLHCLAVNL